MFYNLKTTAEVEAEICDHRKMIIDLRKKIARSKVFTARSEVDPSVIHQIPWENNPETRRLQQALLDVIRTVRSLEWRKEDLKKKAERVNTYAQEIIEFSVDIDDFEF